MSLKSKSMTSPLTPTSAVLMGDGLQGKKGQAGDIKGVDKREKQQRD